MDLFKANFDANAMLSMARYLNGQVYYTNVAQHGEYRKLLKSFLSDDPCNFVSKLTEAYPVTKEGVEAMKQCARQIYESITTYAEMLDYLRDIISRQDLSDITLAIEDGCQYLKVEQENPDGLSGSFKKYLIEDPDDLISGLWRLESMVDDDSACGIVEWIDRIEYDRAIWELVFHELSLQPKIVEALERGDCEISYFPRSGFGMLGIAQATCDPDDSDNPDLPNASDN